MRISEAAKRLGTSARMLRYREELGLLPQVRDHLAPSFRPRPTWPAAGPGAVAEAGAAAEVLEDGADLAEKMEKYYHLTAAEKRAMGVYGRDKVRTHFTKEIVTGIYLDKLKSLR